MNHRGNFAVGTRALNTSLFAIALLAVGATGCDSMDLFSVEVEASEICVRGMQVELAVDETGLAAHQLIEDDLGVEIDDRLEADVRVLSLEVFAGEGTNDLSHLRSLDVDIAQPEDLLAPVAIVDYQHDGNPDPMVVIEASDSINVIDYVRTGSLALDIQLASAMQPAERFSVGMDVCFSGAGAFRQKF